MADIVGQETLERLQAENVFQSSDSELIKKIAYDMKVNSGEWNGLGYLNSMNPSNWDRMLYKIIRIQPAGWESE